ncbi:ABC transporter substrate-binding protein [Streptococcus merionis]|uniref:ABC transporter substrate-binding protein n=1 Tax=Streptococcus merionis TaxID=400065 RepID=UPI0026EEBBAD|nr:extracellular solute-binding protein [Streptococcus merionis]
MNVRKALTLLATITLFGALLTACSGKSDTSSDTASDKTELIAWAWDPNFNIKALEVAKDNYEKENPDKIDLKIVENAQDDIVQKLNTALSSGVTKGLPNIVLIEDYRAKSFLEAYPDSFFPLTDVFNANDFASYKIEASSVDGVNYAIPFDSGATGLYIRKDLLEEAGYTLDDVTNITWAQLQTIGQAIFDKTGAKLLSSDLNAGTLIRGMIQSSGKWYTKEDGATPDIAGNEAMKEAFKTIKSLREANLINIHNNWSEMLKAFNTGVVATVPSGNWITPSITAEESQSGKWAVVPWPRQDVATSVNASNLGGASLYVINSDGKEAAAEFLAATFGSNVDFYKEILDQAGALGTYKPVAESGAYDKEVAYFGGQKIYQDFAKWSEEIPAVNYGKNTYAIEDIIVTSLQDYIGGKDLDKVLADAQKQAETQVK